MRHNLAAKHVRTRDGVLVFEVDTTKATYRGMSWKSLGRYGRRKFENLLVLQNSTDPIHIIYH